MKNVVLMGGVGNQLFQYAFYCKLKELGFSPRFIDMTRAHNGLELDKYFNVDLHFSGTIWKMLLKHLYKLYRRKLFFLISDDEHYSTSCFKLFYSGYWQDRIYFPAEFDLKFENINLSKKNEEVLNMIQKSDSVSIHVRRGDYLKSENAVVFENICSNGYYERAVNYILEHNHNASYFVFSDDIEWVKDKLGIENAVFVDWNKGDDSIIDMYLMSRCKKNIIANSTFSFWGAYLNSHDTVIYPLKWFCNGQASPNIFMDDWIGL